MKVSVIIPIYNVAPYIERCIRSVTNQTYPDIECILVDDCGTDDSMNLCDSFIKCYKGSITFKTIHHERNRGLSAARNTGLLHAAGDYVFFLDSDDELTANSIALLVDKAKEYPDIEMIQGCTTSIPNKPRYDINRFIKHDGCITDNNWIRDNYYKYNPSLLPVNAWNKLLKTRFLLDHHLFFKEGIIYEDVHWMWFLVKHLTSMAFVFQPTYIHYVTPNSIITSQTKEKQALNMGVILQELIYHVDSISYADQLKKILILNRNAEVSKYYRENYGNFIFNVMKKLWAYKEYKSISYLLLWVLCLPMKDSSKLYRKTFESIKY